MLRKLFGTFGKKNLLKELFHNEAREILDRVSDSERLSPSDESALKEIAEKLGIDTYLSEPLRVMKQLWHVENSRNIHELSSALRGERLGDLKSLFTIEVQHREFTNTCIQSSETISIADLSYSRSKSTIEQSLTICKEGTLYYFGGHAVFVSDEYTIKIDYSEIGGTFRYRVKSNDLF